MASSSQGFKEFLVEKLSTLSTSQSSIEKTSRWVQYHQIQAMQGAEIWKEESVKAEPARKLAFLYLCNDVIQKTRKTTPEFVAAFATVIVEAFKDCIRSAATDKDKQSMKRLLKIWGERSIFPDEVFSSLKKSAEKPSSASSPRRESSARKKPKKEKETKSEVISLFSPENSPHLQPPSPAQAEDQPPIGQQNVIGRLSPIKGESFSREASPQKLPKTEFAPQQTAASRPSFSEIEWKQPKTEEHAPILIPGLSCSFADEDSFQNGVDVKHEMLPHSRGPEWTADDPSLQQHFRGYPMEPFHANNAEVNDFSHPSELFDSERMPPPPARAPAWREPRSLSVDGLGVLGHAYDHCSLVEDQLNALLESEGPDSYFKLAFGTERPDSPMGPAEVDLQDHPLVRGMELSESVPMIAVDLNKLLDRFDEARWEGPHALQELHKSVQWGLDELGAQVERLGARGMLVSDLRASVEHNRRCINWICRENEAKLKQMKTVEKAIARTQYLLDKPSIEAPSSVSVEDIMGNGSDWNMFGSMADLLDDVVTAASAPTKPVVESSSAKKEANSTKTSETIVLSSSNEIQQSPVSAPAPAEVAQPQNFAAQPYQDSQGYQLPVAVNQPPMYMEQPNFSMIPPQGQQQQPFLSGLPQLPPSQQPPPPSMIIQSNSGIAHRFVPPAGTLSYPQHAFGGPVPHQPPPPAAMQQYPPPPPPFQPAPPQMPPLVPPPAFAGHPMPPQPFIAMGFQQLQPQPMPVIPQLMPIPQYQPPVPAYQRPLIPLAQLPPSLLPTFPATTPQAQPTAAITPSQSILLPKLVPAKTALLPKPTTPTPDPAEQNQSTDSQPTKPETQEPAAPTKAASPSRSPREVSSNFEATTPARDKGDLHSASGKVGEEDYSPLDAVGGNNNPEPSKPQETEVSPPPAVTNNEQKSAEDEELVARRKAERLQRARLLIAAQTAATAQEAPPSEPAVPASTAPPPPQTPPAVEEQPADKPTTPQPEQTTSILPVSCMESSSDSEEEEKEKMEVEKPESKPEATPSVERTEQKEEAEEPSRSSRKDKDKEKRSDDGKKHRRRRSKSRSRRRSRERSRDHKSSKHKKYKKESDHAKGSDEKKEKREKKRSKEREDGEIDAEQEHEKRKKKSRHGEGREEKDEKSRKSKEKEDGEIEDESRKSHRDKDKDKEKSKKSKRRDSEGDDRKKEKKHKESHR